MSLLDDVSIVVTPNGYKAGELYAVIPVPTEGAELVDCGNFECAVPLSSWGVQDGWTISGNKANYSPNTGRTIFQTITTEVGKVYKISYEVSNWVAKKVGAYVVESSDANTAVYEGDEDGDFSRTFTATGVTAIIRLRTSSTSSNLSIDNTSVKEVVTASADMDVTRNTAATRVDENGLVNYAEILGDELVTNGDFATDLSGWTLSNTDVSNTIVWNNGRADMTADGTTALLLSQTVFEVGKTYKIELDAYNITGTGFKIYDVGSGEVLAIQSDGHYTVYHTTSSTSFDLYRYQGGTSASGEFDNISVKEVTRDNVPRIDYTGGGCPHILAEPMRTNLVTYSSDFSQWLIYDTITRTANYGTSPDGTQNSFKIGSSGASNDFMYLSLSLSSSQSYSLSFFIKNVDSVESKFFTPSESAATITWSGSDITSISDGTYESFGNGWYKITSAATSQSDGGYISRFYPSTSGTASVELYGYQLEVGSYPTSLIPTSGSTVTRNQDIFTRDGIGSLINSTEGVLFVEMAALSDDDGSRYISISDGNSNSNSIRIYYYLSGGYVFIQKYVGGTRTTNLSTNSLTNTDFNKIAIRYNSTTVDVWANGVQILTNADTNVIASGTLNSLKFTKGGGGDNFYGKVKQLQVYDTSLSDTQLAALTS